MTGFVGNIIFRSVFSLETIEDIQIYAYALLASDVLLIPAIVLSMFVVNKIDYRQSQRLIVKLSLERTSMINASTKPAEKHFEQKTPDNEVNFCPICGTKLNDQMIYCKKCGHKVPSYDEAKVVTMCINHLDREADKSCDNCGRPLCRECTVVLSENNYCRPCVEKLIKDRNN